MAELMFKRGKQANLPAIGADGCFYLTTDTNRLYVGQGENNAPVLLNQTVQIVDEVANLPSSPPAINNDFYYCVKENVLAVYREGDGDGFGWVQINTNTDDVIEVDDIEFSEGVLVPATAKEKEDLGVDYTAVKYTLTLDQQRYDLNGKKYEGVSEYEISPLTATLQLKTSDIANIIPEESNVGLELSSQTYNYEGDEKSSVKAAPIGSGSDSSRFVQFVPGENVDSIELIDSNGEHQVQFNTHNTYIDEMQVKHDANTDPYIYVHDTDETEYKIHFGTGDGIEVNSASIGDKTDKIIFTHKEYNTDSDKKVENVAKLDPNGEFNYITGIEMDNGHITKINTGKVEMPFDTHLVDGVSHTVDTWQATFADNNETEWTIDFSEDAKNLKEALEKYVNDGLAAANTAMTFKDTIADPEALKSLTNVEAGDVYFLSGNVSTNEYEYRMGDLFVAVSKTGKPGVVEEDDLKWVHVPAGDELIIDTLFAGEATVVGKAGVTDNNDNGSASFKIVALEDIQGDIKTPEVNESLTFKAGQDLYIVNNTETGSKDEVATIGHRTVTTTTPTDTAAEDAFAVTAITGVDVNNGHVTKVTTKTFNLAQYDMYGANDHIILKDSSDSVRGDIHVQDDDKWIKATVSAGTGDDADVLKIEHIGPQATATSKTVTNDVKLTQEGTLNIISGVHYDEKGHVTQVDTASMTMPQDTTYEFFVAKDSNGTALTGEETSYNPYLTLKDRHDNLWTAQMYADNVNLKISADANKVMFNMVWGSF